MAQILKFFREAAFDDQVTRSMGMAYDQACRSIPERDERTRDAAAKRILARASLGIVDAERLGDAAEALSSKRRAI